MLYYLEYLLFESIFASCCRTPIQLGNPIMSSTELRRIQADQAVIRQAVGIDLPFDGHDIVVNILIALWGLLLAVWVTYVPPERQGVMIAPIYFAGSILLFGTIRSFRRRASRPAIWREFRHALLAAAIFSIAIQVDRWWSFRTGAPRMLSTTAGFFVVGLAMLVMAAIDRNRRYSLGIAVPFIALGFVLPWCDSMRQQLIAIGYSILLGGLATAALQWCRLRSVAAENRT